MHPRKHGFLIFVGTKELLLLFYEHLSSPRGGRFDARTPCFVFYLVEIMWYRGIARQTTRQGFSKLS